MAQLALKEHAAAAALGSAQLAAEHTALWADLYRAGIDVTPASPEDEVRAMDVATHANSSLYFLYSSIRDDWFPGVSPGGASTQNYQGAVFMDMDFWMAPSLYLLSPKLAEALLEYRFLSLNASFDIARIFGYAGSMHAWTAAYQGRPFGCCAGVGGYEDCLEQHVTGDIAFAAWQYYLATRDKAWLLARGWPLLSHIADFFMSRVYPAPSAAYKGKYSIKGVLPVDEWCVDSGCGCESPGVDDDAQMNGVAKASLIAASKAAVILGRASNVTSLWGAVGNQIALLFNASGGGHHDQFNSSTCPDGWGGTHYKPSHTVCPEDVLLLSYPLGSILNITSEVTRADAELFIPLTCLENAGMTTPMHTIVWLSLDEPVLAQAEFNRSMHAACYGPFNVRNEVDKHPDIIGGHFDNSHFLTGDGGYLQALMNGYGGLRIVEAGISLLRPSLPASVGRMRLRGLAWLGLAVEFQITAVQILINVSGTPSFCVRDALGDDQLYRLAAAIDVATFVFPGLLYVCAGAPTGSI